MSTRQKKTFFSLVFSLCFVFIITSYVSSQENSIIGKWEYVGAKGATATFEFYKDGTYIQSAGVASKKGACKFIDSNKIRIERLNEEGISETGDLEISFTKEGLLKLLYLGEQTSYTIYKRIE